MSGLIVKNRLYKKMESMVRKALFGFQLLEGVTKLGIGLSGGKDSLCLMFFLKAISGRGFPELDLHAFHIHGSVACPAKEHLLFLEKICQELAIPLTVVRTEQTAATLSCYPCSRRRRTLLFNLAKAHGIDTIAFGHHKDDHIQTTLMNLFHKGEFAGLLPKIQMQRYGITIIRPLIYVDEEDLRKLTNPYKEYLTFCQCPVGPVSVRKQTDQLISQIEELFPQARENIAAAALLYGNTKAQNP